MRHFIYFLILFTFVLSFKSYSQNDYSKFSSDFAKNLNQAVGHYQAKRYKEAIAPYELVKKEILDLKIFDTKTAYVLKNLADCYARTEQFDKAVERYEEASFILKESKESKSEINEVLSEVAYGFMETYISSKKYKKAKAYAEQLVQIYKDLKKSPIAIQTVEGHLGQIERLRKKKPRYYTDKELLERINLKFNDSQKAKDDIKKGGDLIKQKEWTQAIPYFEENFATGVYFFSENDGDKKLKTFTNSLGLAYKIAGFTEKNEEDLIFAKAKEIQPPLLEKKAEQLEILRVLEPALQSYYKGDYKDVVERFEKVFPTTKKYFADDPENYAIVINMMAIAYFQLGDYQKAEPLMLETKEIYEKLEKTNTSDYAACLKSLALVYFNRGLYAQAEQYILEAQKALQKAKMSSSTQYSATLDVLANIQVKTGRTDEAVKNYQESIRICEEAKGDCATNYFNLAYTYKNMQKVDLAEKLFLESTELIRKKVGEQHPEYATSLFGLGSFYYGLGIYQKAEKFHLQAYEIRKNKLGTNHPDYLFSLVVLSQLYADMEDGDKAIKYATQSLSLLTFYPSKDLNYSDILYSFASILRKYWIFDKAEQLLDEVLVIKKNILGEEHEDVAGVYNSIASLKIDQEKYDEANEYCQKSIDLYKKIYGKEEEKYIDALFTQSRIYWAKKEYKQLEPLMLRLVDFRLKEIDEVFDILNEEEKKAYINSVIININDFSRFVLRRYKENPELAGKLLDVLLDTKAMIFSAGNQVRSNILASNDQEAIKLYNEWRTKKDLLIKAQKLNEEQKKAYNLSEKTLSDEVSNLEKELTRKSAFFAKKKKQSQQYWKDIQKKLAPNEAAIEMLRLVDREGTLTDTLYVALVVTSQTPQPILISIKGNELEADDIHYYKNNIRFKRKDNRSYQVFWQPIEAVLNQQGNINKVYFSPDGAYNEINLNTLYNPTDNTYLIDKREMINLTNLREIFTLSEEQKKVDNVILIGFPAYNSSGESEPILASNLQFISSNLDKEESRFFDGQDIGLLPGTKKEVENISSILQKKQVNVVAKLENEADEAFVKSINNPTVLHIATHGFFLENAPQLTNSLAPSLSENPLLKSGLLLAGAKNAFTDKGLFNGEDGILTAYEASNLQLFDTELVVMSACETGLGEVSYGEGVYGLQRAFRLAGAKSIIMSLWKVNDTSTQELMTLFYEYWLTGNSKKEAFRKAQLDIRKKYSHPYYWGAFVMIGE